jgi:hypothetical protein
VAFPRLINEKEVAGSLHGIKIYKNRSHVSHLLFADSLMVFAKVKANEASSILNCLKKLSE